MQSKDSTGKTIKGRQRTLSKLKGKFMGLPQNVLMERSQSGVALVNRIDHHVELYACWSDGNQ